MMKHQPGGRTDAEVRNYLCLEMNRDAATRRFIQYLSQQTSRLVILAQDAKTGRVVVKPPEEELWTIRAPHGDPEDNEWFHIKEFDEQFFQEMEQMRGWSFGFPDYYDIIIWDLEPGEDFGHLYGYVQQTLFKANRCVEPKDMYKMMGPVIKTLTRERDTFRLREIKPGEDVMSLWDDLHHPGSSMEYGVGPDRQRQSNPPDSNVFYNEVDELEDAWLFPDDAGANVSASQLSKDMNEITTFERSGPSERMFKRFVNDLDTDEELDSDREEEWQKQKKERKEKKKHRGQAVGRHTETRSQEQVNDEDDWIDEPSEDDTSLKDLMERLKAGVAALTPEQKEIDKIMQKFEATNPRPDPNDDLQEVFMEFFDSEKARSKHE